MYIWVLCWDKSLPYFPTWRKVFSFLVFFSTPFNFAYNLQFILMLNQEVVLHIHVLCSVFQTFYCFIRPVLFFNDSENEFNSFETFNKNRRTYLLWPCNDYKFPSGIRTKTLIVFFLFNKSTNCVFFIYNKLVIMT